MNRAPISEILSGDDLDRFAAHWRVAREVAAEDQAPGGIRLETDAELRARVLDRIRPAPEETADGTTLGEARAIVAGWLRAHDLTYLSPDACRDLARRIEAAMIAERAEP